MEDLDIFGGFLQLWQWGNHSDEVAGRNMFLGQRWDIDPHQWLLLIPFIQLQLILCSS